MVEKNKKIRKPKKPTEPKKPLMPSKFIDRFEILESCSYMDDETVHINFSDILEKLSEGYDLNDVKIKIWNNKKESYSYNCCCSSYSSESGFQIYYKISALNPDYEKNLEKYNKEYLLYEEKMKKYRSIKAEYDNQKKFYDAQQKVKEVSRLKKEVEKMEKDKKKLSSMLEKLQKEIE